MKLFFSALALSGGISLAVHAEPEQIEPTFESISQHFETPEWLQDAKFGVVTHWGPVTHAIRHHDQPNFGWYARAVHREGSAQQAYHRKHFGDPKDVSYTDLISGFTAPKFNADEWADIIATSGAKFSGPTAIHHDNFAMWDSEILRWNAADMGPKRDVIGELAAAYRKRGVKFMGCFHHGYTYHFYGFARKQGYEGSDSAYADFYGPVDERDQNKKFVPRAFQEQWLALINEFNAKYQPDILYYDFGLGWQDEDIQYQMYADYYNAARANGQEVTVLQKDRNPRMRSISTMDLERGRMDAVTDYTWTTDTSPGAWFYYPNMAMESSDAMIDMLVDIVSKNGVMILNIPPNHEGIITSEFRAMLAEFGVWLQVNGEGIYDTRPWPIYGAGTVITEKSHFKIENTKAKKNAAYSAKDIRYTRSKDGKTVYAFTLGWPEGPVTYAALSIESKGPDAQVHLLGYESPLSYIVNKDQTITVTFPDLAAEARPTDFAHGLRFSGFTIQPHPDGHFNLPSTQRIPADKAVVHGWSILNADGRIHNWSAWWGTSHWLFTNKQKNQAYDLRCHMSNGDGNSELRIVVLSDKGERHEFSVQPPKTGKDPEYVTLGQVKLKHDGVFHVVIAAQPEKLSRNAIEIYELQVAPSWIPESADE